MKSIPEIAEALDLSSTTIREYIKRFNEFFADPVEHEGLKEYPDDTLDLVRQIHIYYTETEMTKNEIRVKLGGGQVDDGGTGAAVAASAAAPVAAPVDNAQFRMLGEKLDRLIGVIEALTDSLVKAGELGFVNARTAYSGNEKLDQITSHITEIVEMSKGSDGENLEKNVKDADGTIIFSFGRLSPNAIDSLNFAKAHNKPWLHIDLETEKNPGPILRKWISQFEIKVLNVAGRRAAKMPGLKKSVNDILALVMKE
ncbi:MAG: hypothetical protein MI802_05085 [Desulfobacterales bacterium]|nr:hypothetical protein [Desulfobacterales bacterium]